jgi:hypothetical protein
MRVKVLRGFNYGSNHRSGKAKVAKFLAVRTGRLEKINRIRAKQILKIL